MVWYSYKDVVHQLNFVWTTLILAIFALIIGFLRYYNLIALITCWTPAQFTTMDNAYVHQICWEKNTASILQLNEPIDTDRSNQRPVFHTWIPILVIYLIIGFKIPEAIKVLLDLCIGLKPKSLVATTDSWKDRSESLAECGRDIVQRGGIIKTLSFFLVMIFILINLIAQFTFIQKFVHGYNGVNNVTLDVFPKTLICDFNIVQMQNVRDYVVQCHMPVSTLYEAFFRLFGYWILGVGLLTGVMFLFQIGTLMVSPLVGIRFRGIIPEKELKLRGFSVDDSLLFLEEIKDEFGIAMARSVASKMWSNPKMIQNEAMTPMPIMEGRGGFQQSVGNESYSGDGSVYPLLDRPTVIDNRPKA